MRIAVFGEGPLNAAVWAALRARGHILFGPYASPQPTNILTDTQASVGLSAGYRHKLTAAEWSCFPNGILNLHTGYLPWNKGAYPNVWPILDGSPAGVTLHRVDAGIDTGPILFQARVTVEPWDTAGTLYDKLLVAAVSVVEWGFQKAEHDGRWPDGMPQEPDAGTRHFKRELAYDPEVIDNDEWWFMNQLRARTFPGYGLRYRQDGKLLEASISIREVKE